MERVASIARYGRGRTSACRIDTARWPHPAFGSSSPIAQRSTQRAAIGHRSTWITSKENTTHVEIPFGVAALGAVVHPESRSQDGTQSPNENNVQQRHRGWQEDNARRPRGSSCPADAVPLAPPHPDRTGARQPRCRRARHHDRRQGGGDIRFVGGGVFTPCRGRLLRQRGSRATTLSPAVVAALAVPAATLDAVGAPSSVALPRKVGDGSGIIGRGADGKPLITYIGAEYCPYCAAERWALAVALSRFGTFTNLSGTHSSTTDIYPNTQTLSFYGSTYTSPYVDFQAVEEASNQQVGGSYATLQAPTAAQSALLSKEDPQGSIPFLDIANRYVVTGSSFSPQVLEGLSRSQIATQLTDPSSAVAQAVDGAANAITAAITSVTGNKPSDVANSAAVAAIAQKLGA